MGEHVRLRAAMVAIVFLGAGAGALGALWATHSANPANALAGAAIGSSAPAIAASDNQCASVAVSWQQADNADDYRLERRSESGPWQTVVSSTAGQTAIIDNPGPAGQGEAEYRVVPRRAGSMWEGPHALTPVLDCPGTPMNISAQNSCNISVLRFGAHPLADAYLIERRVDAGPWVIVDPAAAGSPHVDPTVHADGASVQYRARPLSGGVPVGPYSDPALIASWSSFRVTGVQFINTGTLGNLNPGDQLVIDLSWPVDTNASALTSSVRVLPGSARAGSARPNAGGIGAVSQAGVFSGPGEKAGTVGWEAGATRWRWVAGAGASGTMAALTAPVWSPAEGAICALPSDIGPQPAEASALRASSPPIGGRW